MRRFLVAISLLLSVLALGWASGCRSPVDEVALAARRTGVEFESRRIDVGELSLHVVFAGPPSGKPVLLLHGFPECWFTWHRQMAILSKAGFRVAAPDLRGYNRSDKPAGASEYTGAHSARDLIGLMDALGWSQARLSGHDYGGGLAWRLLAVAPDRFPAAVIFNTPHVLAWEAARPQDDPDTVSWFRTAFLLPWLPEFLTRVGDWYLPAYYLRSTSRPGAFSDEDLDVFKGAWARDGAMSTMINGYRAPRSPISELPSDFPRGRLQVIWGEKDAFIPLQGAKLTEKILPPGSVIYWPEATHWLLHEEPERTAQALIDFF